MVVVFWLFVVACSCWLWLVVVGCSALCLLSLVVCLWLVVARELLVVDCLFVGSLL